MAPSRPRLAAAPEAEHEQVHVLLLPPKRNDKVAAYYRRQQPVEGAPAWTTAADIPSAAEVEDLVQEGEATEVVILQANKPEGSWESKEAYLSAHYQLMREDAIRPLREAVCQLRITPQATEDTFTAKIGIYEKVKIIGYTASNRGFAVRASFSIKRCGKAIQWSQTDRLRAGSLVALSRKEDQFTKVIVATIASRCATDGDYDPPELDLFIADDAKLEIDPSAEWTMVEARGSLYEASKHVLTAIQHMANEKSPLMLQEHLVEVKQEVMPPDYILKNPTLDLSSVFTSTKHAGTEAVNVLTDWPSEGTSALDASQAEALKAMLAKQLSLIQGPPGTGKTFVTVQAIRIMLANLQGGPPIVVACQTNHAIDQILRLVAEFEPSFARLGGFSKDEGVIKARTLFELRKQFSQANLPGGLSTSAYKRCRAIEKDLENLLEPLTISETAIHPQILLKYKLLTETQVKKLDAGASRWVQAELIGGDKAKSSFHIWLANKLVKVPPKPLPENLAFELEEEDPELEQLDEHEAEGGKEEAEIGLVGTRYNLADNFTCAHCTKDDLEKAAKLLEKEQDLWKIPERNRGPVYLYLQKQLKKQLTELARIKVKAFNEAVRDSQIGRFEKDEVILREQKVIGMTTTGLNKYRGMLAALGCKIVIIEEAAETLEAPVLTACFESLEHLVLVGDHKQLRPHCQNKDHENEPWYLNVSLFERMVNNGISMVTLRKQRRMIPEIRRLLRPIYGNIIKDHHSVEDRSDIPGMGGINSWFFSHPATETRDNHMSFINREEADLILGFARYLIKNGMSGKEITIITFYRGQYALLHKLFRKTGVTIATVDSYQGEENKVVILSTVRSNTNRSIGFLSVDNRTCVALSRAQNGFYIFGNAMLLAQCPTWRKVINIMAGNHKAKEVPAREPQRFDKLIPIHCQNHGVRTDISSSSDWENNDGGCHQKCFEMLLCGHKCPLSCHPFAHDKVVCNLPCEKELKCGHKCKEICSKACVCAKCTKEELAVKKDKENVKGKGKEKVEIAAPALNESQRLSSWQIFAVQDAEHSRSSSGVSVAPRKGSPLRYELLIEGLDTVSLDHGSSADARSSPAYSLLD